MTGEQSERAIQQLDADSNRHACPNCQSTILDGQGDFIRELKTKRLGSVGSFVRRQYWYQMRCGDCEQVFAIRQSVETDTDREVSL